jgi:hypothetical protein
MSPHWVFRGLCTGALGGLTALLLIAAPASADLAADHALMMEWFEGEFDKFQQVWVERETRAEHPHDTRIGIHLRWIQAGFKLEQPVQQGQGGEQ